LELVKEQDDSLAVRGRDPASLAPAVIVAASSAVPLGAMPSASVRIGGRAGVANPRKERCSMTYPVSFEMDYVRRRSRLTTFFRYILAIPHFIFAYIYALIFYVVLIIAWFVLLFTARWPESLYRFSCGFLRYITRLGAYMCLGVDRYPPFSGGDDDSYPVRVRIAPPLDHYSRLKVLFRPIYAILAFVIRYALGLVLTFVTFLSWFAIVITGRQPESIQNALGFSLSYTTRADALMFLITETYPTIDDNSAI
jgi:hypothetical protein